MGRAIIYTRVSSKAQEDGYSLDNQKQDAERYCGQHGHTVVGVESDTFSGYDTMDEREGMQRAIKRIRNGGADALVIWRVDRAGRFQLDNSLLHRDVSEAGGTFESVAEGLIPNTAEGRLMLSVLSFAGEKEWEAFKARAAMGKQQRVNLGHLQVGGVPLYGYTFRDVIGKYGNKAEYVIDPESGPVVAEMYAKADMGWSIKRICRWLNETGVPTPSKLLYNRGELPGTRKVTEEWSHQKVRDILGRESYTGKHYNNRWQSKKVKYTDANGKKKIRNTKHLRAADDAQRVPTIIPAIISPELWQRVQVALQGRHPNWDHVATDEPLLTPGLAVCGICGQRVIAPRRYARNYRIYRCSHRSGAPVDTQGICPGRAYAIKTEEVDADVWNQTKEIVKNQEQFQRLVKSKVGQLAELIVEACDREIALFKQIDETKAWQATVYQRMMCEDDEGIAAMHRQELKRVGEMLAELGSRAESRHDEVGILQKHQDIYKQAKVLADAIVAESNARHRGEAVDPFDSLSQQDKRRLVRAIDGKVEMFPVDSEYARTHDKRWKFTYTGMPQGGVLSEGTM